MNAERNELRHAGSSETPSAKTPAGPLTSARYSTACSVSVCGCRTWSSPLASWEPKPTSGKGGTRDEGRLSGQTVTAHCNKTKGLFFKGVWQLQIFDHRGRQSQHKRKVPCSLFNNVNVTFVLTFIVRTDFLNQFMTCIYNNLHTHGTL